MQKQPLGVNVKPFTFVFCQESGGIRPQSELVDEDYHLLPVGEGALHKVKGRLQRIAGYSNGLLAAAYLCIKTGAHRVKRFLVVHMGVKFLPPAA